MQHGQTVLAGIEIGKMSWSVLWQDLESGHLVAFGQVTVRSNL